MYPTKEHLMYIKQVLTNNRKIDSNTVLGYFDTPLTSVNRSSGQKFNKVTLTLNNTLHQMS